MDELYDASKVILSLEGCVFGPEIRSIFRPREDLALRGGVSAPNSSRAAINVYCFCLHRM